LRCLGFPRLPHAGQWGFGKPKLEECPQGRIFIAPAPAPTGPVEGSSKGSLLSDLKVHVHSIRGSHLWPDLRRLRTLREDAANTATTI